MTSNGRKSVIMSDESQFATSNLNFSYISGGHVRCARYASLIPAMPRVLFRSIRSI